MIAFIAGVFIGSICGVTVMAIARMAEGDDENGRSMYYGLGSVKDDNYCSYGERSEQ